jgi:hypothetical protein
MKQVADHKIDKVLGSTGSFMGITMMVFGAIGTYFNPAALILVAAGMFMAFTYDGTMIDFSSRRIKGYTCFFGLIRLGKWHPADSFDKFRIYKSRRSSTYYSRAGLPLDMSSSDIRLVFMDNGGSLKVTINKFSSFEEARMEMTSLINDLHLAKLESWAKEDQE